MVFMTHVFFLIPRVVKVDNCSNCVVESKVDILTKKLLNNKVSFFCKQKEDSGHVKMNFTSKAEHSKISQISIIT